ncbi:MAG: patatin-like phospholipase family protein [Rudaea sp.]|uniref:patatin-like phospholipase family protein n=1 Tax=unclassified Rudaea TaxID=2627037 RepID=UPI001485112A|nr:MULTISPECIES: patatin-like phospholipase family protein [unclassified Rudaea]MBN8884303.1 patatin-like phospholipase family protein [Rudaea sp.]MBR0346554.1 patatin-like phospholipase family protein [Rudaea sp.]
MTGKPAESKISLALQGGGAHGAFTWGVLDYLLEQGSFDFDGISATSSGAMNACALTQGWLDGERDGARAMLSKLWESVAAQASLMRWAFATPAGAATERILLGLTRYFTPQEMNPLGINPVKNIASALFDFDRIRANSPFKLFVAATRVRDGRLRLFDNTNLDLDSVLASTCLPQLFAPVEIDGEMYWDGGYAGNPAIEPLVYRCDAETIACVLVQPIERAQAPATAREIGERITELSFSTTFIRELETLQTAQSMLAKNFPLTPLGQRLRKIDIQMIEPGESLDHYSAKTRLTARIDFLRDLRDLGRDCAQAWCERVKRS